MNMNRDLLVLIGSVTLMFVAVVVILANSIISADRNFAAVIDTEDKINSTLVSVNRSITDIIKDNAADRQRDANNSAKRFEQGEDQRQLQLNLSKISIPLLLDINEDLEEVKKVLNISSDDPEDKIKIELNNTHITINNDTTIEVADFLPPPVGAPLTTNITDIRLN